jgi:hypothetical protein
MINIYYKQHTRYHKLRAMSKHRKDSEYGITENI